jgi:hypothetical protein
MTRIQTGRNPRLVPVSGQVAPSAWPETPSNQATSANVSHAAQPVLICRVCGRGIRQTASGFGHVIAVPRSVEADRHYPKPQRPFAPLA